MVRRKLSRKRGGQIHNRKPRKQSNRTFPVMWCIDEDLVIGVSWTPMKFKGDGFGNIKARYKINYKHWQPGRCKFRSEEYIIDLKDYEEGKLVKCPKCGSRIDFRLFPSATCPQMVEIKKDKE